MGKRLIIVLILLAAVAIFFVSREFNDRNSSFSLLDQIEERQVIGVLNLNELLDNGRSISKRFRTFGIADQYLNEVSNVMKDAGLRLDKVFYSLETRNKYKRSVYFEITNQEKLRNTFSEFSTFHQLTQDSLDTSLHYSREYNIAIRIQDKWIELIQGDISELEHNPMLSKTARDLLEKGHFFSLNPTEQHKFDSLEYITGDYHYDSILTIEGSWYCARKDKHPIQIEDKKLMYYPTDEDLISAHLNVNRESWKKYQNTYLQEKLENTFSKGMIDYPKLSKHWDGQFAFNFGGKKTIQTEKIVTEFDENFNSIEKTIIQTDTIRDVGFVFSSNDAEALHEELLNQKNIKLKDGYTHIALLPPLNSNYQNDQLIVSAGDNELVEQKVENVFQFNFYSSELDINASAKSEKHHLNFHLEIVPQVQGKIKWNELVNLFL